MYDHVGVVSDLTLEQFRTGYLEFQSAFNRGDFASAFAVVAPDCEFQWIEELREDQVKVGREEIIGVFEDLREVVPDWRFETTEFLQAADDVFVTLDRGRGRGRGSDVPVVQELASVHRIRDGLLCACASTPVGSRVSRPRASTPPTLLTFAEQGVQSPRDSRCDDACFTPKHELPGATCLPTSASATRVHRSPCSSFRGSARQRSSRLAASCRSDT
jgi:ketosteroid isomerase-like protein